jgi:hypothetical protein
MSYYSSYYNQCNRPSIPTSIQIKGTPGDVGPIGPPGPVGPIGPTGPSGGPV